MDFNDRQIKVLKMCINGAKLAVEKNEEFNKYAGEDTEKFIDLVDRFLYIAIAELELGDDINDDVRDNFIWKFFDLVYEVKNEDLEKKTRELLANLK